MPVTNGISVKLFHGSFLALMALSLLPIFSYRSCAGVESNSDDLWYCTYCLPPIKFIGQLTA